MIHMTRKLRWLSLAGLLVLLGACSDDPEESKTTSPCEDVVCAGDSTCDPLDGICKCGDGADRITCGSGQICQLEPSPSCISDLCDLVTCRQGQTCDSADGLCKCGGEVCESGETCLQNECKSSTRCDGVVCAESIGESCDPADGLCKCGNDVCSFGQSCQAGACEQDLCAGTNCGAGMVCNPGDGTCHCGSEGGPICSLGQVCVMEDGVPRCEGYDVCADAGQRCFGGTVCDPTDPEGACRCGGIGPLAPVCARDQSCFDGECIGGDKCFDVVCGSGTACDPEDGLCKCGGMGGQICDEVSEVCTAREGKAVCANTCDPRDFAPACDEAEGCYFDTTGSNPKSYCMAAGNGAEGSSCDSPSDCQAGYHCMSGSSGSKCRAYCSTKVEGSCPDGGTCLPIPSGPDGLGFCISF